MLSRPGHTTTPSTENAMLCTVNVPALRASRAAPLAKRERRAKRTAIASKVATKVATIESDEIVTR